jgi:diaminohydroxyphosphoribosylaminopyrimidine deaminase/5-amino-6-(5-phosphoribosylamino)uracil reductase
VASTPGRTRTRRRRPTYPALVPANAEVGDERSQLMAAAIAAAGPARRVAAPNPWVGAALLTRNGRQFAGATEAPGQRHAEIVAIEAARAAGADLRGATLAVTLEPCCHYGRTGPCTEAIIDAEIDTVYVGVEDPDVAVAGRGLARLREAGIALSVGVRVDEVSEQLRAYLHHRRTGRPFVVLKMATTLDGRVAAADGTSRWITGDAARAAVHQLRADSDAVLVGAGTVAADDPELTVRHHGGMDSPTGESGWGRDGGMDSPDPQRVVLGHAPADARIHPCWEMSGPLPEILDELGDRGILQLLVEGGPTVAQQFQAERLIDRYVFHLAPALTGGDDGTPIFKGMGASTIADLWRGRILSTRMLGPDIEIVLDAEEIK